MPTPSRHTTATAVIINEVANKGGGGVCAGEDWIELFNMGAAEVDLAGYKLHDDKGAADEDVWTFPAGQTIAAGAYKLICAKVGSSCGVKLQVEPGLTALSFSS